MLHVLSDKLANAAHADDAELGVSNKKKIRKGCDERERDTGRTVEVRASLTTTLWRMKQLSVDKKHGAKGRAETDL